MHVKSPALRGFLRLLLTASHSQSIRFPESKVAGFRRALTDLACRAQTGENAENEPLQSQLRRQAESPA